MLTAYDSVLIFPYCFRSLSFCSLMKTISPQPFWPNTLKLISHIQSKGAFTPQIKTWRKSELSHCKDANRRKLINGATQKPHSCAFCVILLVQTQSSVCRDSLSVFTPCIPDWMPTGRRTLLTTCGLPGLHNLFIYHGLSTAVCASGGYYEPTNKAIWFYDVSGTSTSKDSQ